MRHLQNIFQINLLFTRTTQPALAGWLKQRQSGIFRRRHRLINALRGVVVEVDQSGLLGLKLRNQRSNQSGLTQLGIGKKLTMVKVMPKMTIPAASTALQVRFLARCCSKKSPSGTGMSFIVYTRKLFGPWQPRDRNAAGGEKKEDAKSLFQSRGKVPEMIGYVMARVGAAQIMRTSFEDSSITDSNRGHLPLRTARLAMGRTACILRSSDEKSWNMSTERTHNESRGKVLTKVRFCVF